MSGDPTLALPEVDVLLPRCHSPSSIPADPEEHELLKFYAHSGPSHRSTTGTYVRANMVSSLDGAAWGADHRSGSINNDADFRAFRVQRALADVVLVGAGTIRAERYTTLDVPESLVGQRSRAGRSQNLELAVATRSGAVPAALLESERPPLVITSEQGAQSLPATIDSGHVLITGEQDVDLARGLRLLAERGLTRVLTEGGPHLLGALLQNRLVDELCLTFSPLIIGLDSGRIVQGVATPPDLTARPEHLLHSDGVLLGRWRLSALE